MNIIDICNKKRLKIFLYIFLRMKNIYITFTISIQTKTRKVMKTTIEQAQRIAKEKDARIVTFRPVSDGANLLSAGYNVEGLPVCHIYKSFDAFFRPEIQVRYTANEQ